ncbi:hypothetical protein [Bartonella sp. CB175]|uniref:hypothetical protein n=1 Tax=Bartonella sp. CB175 TaxID=3112256 RepID=UPI00300E05EC
MPSVFFKIGQISSKKSPSCGKTAKNENTQQHSGKQTTQQPLPVKKVSLYLPQKTTAPKKRRYSPFIRAFSL